MKGAKSCHTCGGKGRFARECPSKGEGKVQEGGWSKGGSREGTKAKAVARVARTKSVSPRASRRVANMARAAARVQLAAVGHVEDPCFASDCPWKKSRTYQLGEWFPQEWESTPTELLRFIKEKAKPLEARAETHNQPSYACSVHNSFGSFV